MKILVCVKQVPDTDAPIGLDSENAWMKVDPSSSFRMNRFDECAVEEAVRIQESLKDVSIDVLSVGPESFAVTIKRALAVGGDRGIHLQTADGGYLAPRVIAGWIASVARERSYDLILTGVMSEDAMHGQVGPLVAELLSLPCATSVVLEKLDQAQGTVYVEREIEGGMRDTLEIRLPAVLTIQTGINEPRYPALPNILKAKKKSLEVIDAATLPKVDPLIEVTRASFPQKARNAQFLEGTQEEKARQLIEILKRKALI